MLVQPVLVLTSFTTSFAILAPGRSAPVEIYPFGNPSANRRYLHQGDGPELT